MAIEGVHTIEGRGTVATGKIEQGRRHGRPEGGNSRPGRHRWKVSSPVSRRSNVLWTIGEAGQNVGVLLRGIKADQIQRGQVIAAPRTIRPQCEVQGVRFTS